jgi:serine/threonine-protein kinase HipA
MARRTKRLEVWLGGLHVADLEQTRWPSIRCRYTPLALERWPNNSPVISCSLPLVERPQDALAFCRGLLPEGQALQQMAASAGVAVNETFGLLARFGRDVAGALVIGEEPPDPSRFGVAEYDDETLYAEIIGLAEHPLGAHDDSELSLAGLQDKLLLVELDGGRWGRPLHGRPSTHILKMDDPRHLGLIAAEAECLELARHLDLTTIESRLISVGDETPLVISRFDRIVRRDGSVDRVHQEDLCQALAMDPGDARGGKKYERYGGPSLRDAARLLDLYSADPAAELDKLLRAATFTVLIGNADAHGKNLAFLHPTPETVSLAPLYDTVPTLLWPKLRKDAAMRIGGRSLLTEITVDDLVREAHAWGIREAQARESAAETVNRALQGLDEGLLRGFSEVGALVRNQAATLLAG